MAGFEPLYGERSMAFEAHSFCEPDEEGFSSWLDTGLLAADEFEPESEPVDVEALAQEAYELGKTEAERALAQEREQLERDRETLASTVDALTGVRQQWLAQSAREVGEVVLAMARRVVGDALALHPDALVQVVASALEQLPLEDELTVRVPPGQTDALNQALGLREGLVIVPDEEVQEGAVVQTRYGQVEATVHTAMAGIQEAVRAWQEDQGA